MEQNSNFAEEEIQLKDYLKTLNKTIGFVPTMGALHDGHISLIKRAKEENEVYLSYTADGGNCSSVGE